MKRIIIPGVFAIVALVSAAAALADDLDGNNLILCANSQVQTCTRNGECIFSPPEAIDLTPFVEIEFKQNQISDTLDKEGERKTTIEHKKITDNEIILQGYQTYAWSLVISRITGNMTFTVSGDDEGFVIFGSCTEI